ncbi:hypothetical protein SARC_10382 [Sphaeroforma arctica JP610]|uniref:Uncharacterized protein n=1 Tax=Sphaeroforma arctica JP610 TaxID=667725 RepID=A0A0L0FK54_9EUKA|nr:hypothetical protein SARC_10382 [Sphaeroforma arctica JP610]KNC77152.1 hypothetical protein SARC_10382 [Sphaeroforma arctica JP610]|eukprot:XP_014151054.1 hypothetical protein SARC_10382 [Sphaeroforma arctica JP610]
MKKIIAEKAAARFAEQEKSALLKRKQSTLDGGGSGSFQSQAIAEANDALSALVYAGIIDANALRLDLFKRAIIATSRVGPNYRIPSPNLVLGTRLVNTIVRIRSSVYTMIDKVIKAILMP